MNWLGYLCLLFANFFCLALCLFVGSWPFFDGLRTYFLSLFLRLSVPLRLWLPLPLFRFYVSSLALINGNLRCRRQLDETFSVSPWTKRARMGHAIALGEFLRRVAPPSTHGPGQLSLPFPYDFRLFIAR